MPQYFESDGGLKRNFKRIAYTYGGREFSFLTCDGVFAKDGVDPFSAALLDCAGDCGVTGDVLDMGCGYGAVGVIAAGTFPGVRLCQSDINRNAAELAAENARLNGVASRVILSDGYENIDGLFDWVLMNPPIHAGKERVYRLFGDTKAHLKEKGKLLVVIHKKHGAESALRELERVYGEVGVVYRKKGLYIMMCGVSGT
ncbi:MAG: methyltransferase [Firmicutes bacterium]|nr:methyltransferase [Bacillota bacterium]